MYAYNGLVFVGSMGRIQLGITVIGVRLGWFLRALTIRHIDIALCIPSYSISHPPYCIAWCRFNCLNDWEPARFCKVEIIVISKPKVVMWLWLNLAEHLQANIPQFLIVPNHLSSTRPHYPYRVQRFPESFVSIRTKSILGAVPLASCPRMDVHICSASGEDMS